jgi:hypothetical protein
LNKVIDVYLIPDTIWNTNILQLLDGAAELATGGSGKMIGEGTTGGNM